MQLQSLDLAVELLDVPDVELLLHQLQVIAGHRPPDPADDVTESG